MVEKVFALSGSAITDSPDRIRETAEALETHGQILAVTGAGGHKKFIEAVRNCSNQGEQDLVGIRATRLNARTLISAMDSAYPKIPEKPGEILEASSSEMNVVMGGLTPGYSTDAVAAVAAELLEADLYLASNVPGVYNDSEKVMDEVSTTELRDITSGNGDAGDHALIDSTALGIIERSGIETRIFEASAENLEDPSGKGTLIVPDA